MKVYWFGRFLDSSVNSSFIKENWQDCEEKQSAFDKITIDETLSLLSDLKQAWGIDGAWYNKALKVLSVDENPEEIKKLLSHIPSICDPELWRKKLLAEFGDLTLLDKFIRRPEYSGFVKASSLGTILHVTAGNVFLSSIESLITGLLTKNTSIIKLSQQNLVFPFLFAESLSSIDKKNIVADKFALLSWKGGSPDIEDTLKNLVQGIVAWGGEEMVLSYRKNLPLHVKFIDYGPKISLQILSVARFSNDETVAEKIVQDVISYNQQACASPQNLFVEEGLDVRALMNTLELAFKNASKRSSISSDESVEILKEKYRALFSLSEKKGDIREGEDFLLHYETTPYLRPSPLNRTLIIKPFKNISDLSYQLGPFRFYLQSCGLGVQKEERSDYTASLARLGMRRFTHLGEMMDIVHGGPHDGKYSLRELVNFVADEANEINSVSEAVLHDAYSIREVFETTLHPPGYIFASGGTTGKPKYVHFSHHEFDRTTGLIADDYRFQGARSGMVAANLFMAGNLWSSFLATESAFKKIGLIQLPIGAQCSIDNILMYLDKFKPQIIAGIPSTLSAIAEACEERNIDLQVDYIFYAGESLTEGRKSFLQKVWNCKRIGSAGYASVDAGVIGYQCAFSETGVHHVFSQEIKLEIVNDEAVVTSKIRDSLPIVRYRTGDSVRWVEGKCLCGSDEPRFKLMGRIDQQIQVWSTRFTIEELDRFINRVKLSFNDYQLVVDEYQKIEIIKWYLSGCDLGPEELNHLKKGLYLSLIDVKDTISFETFDRYFIILNIDDGLFVRNSRTGKLSRIVDRRFQ